MKLCAQCRAMGKEIRSRVRRAVLDGGVVVVPEGVSYKEFQKMILKRAKVMNVEISTRVCSKESPQSIRVRRFYE